MIRRPPRSTQSRSSAASDVYKRQENGHPEGKTSVCAGPAMDMQILRDLFENCIQAAKTLEVDQALSANIAAARARLAPHQIGSAGQLQEWLKDWDMQPGPGSGDIC